MKKLAVLALTAGLALVLAGCASSNTPVPTETTVHLQQEREKDDTITVSGRMELEVPPDVAKISIGVSSQGSTPEAAREENATAINATLAALEELGIEEKDMQTSSINLWNRYDNNGNRNGYRMSTDLTVYVRDIEKAGDAIDAAIAAGTNELNGIEYLVSNRDELYNQALTDAIALAREKAEALAAAANKALVEVKQVDETSRAAATVKEYNPATGGIAVAEDTVKTSIRPGSTSISAEVQVVFRVE